MARGRPVKSNIRQNIVEILFFMKEGYGYDVYKIYIKIFPRVTMRSVYYHLNKGVETKEFKIAKVKVEKGDYSWGKTVQKVYYGLGKKAKPKIDKRVENFFKKKKK